MMLRALTYRKSGMETLIQKAISGGHDGVINMQRMPLTTRLDRKI